AAAPPPDAARPPVPDVERLLDVLGAATVLETHDGHVADIRTGDPDVTVEALSRPDALEAGLGAIAGEPEAFTALNLAFAPDPLRIRIRRGSSPAPVVVVHRSDTSGVAVFPRLLVEVDDAADASVLEVVAGRG